MASIKPRKNGKIILQELSKAVFINNISESRTETVEYFNFNKSRCKVLSENDKIAAHGKHGILYWMTRECRTQDNWSLIYAQKLALEHKYPLFVCFNIFDAHYFYPTIRQYKFLIDGLKLVKSECDDLNLKFYLFNTDPQQMANIIDFNKIAAVVCDLYPLKQARNHQDSFLLHLPKDVPLVLVDGHNIVPCWEASCKQELMAKTIRPKIHKQLDEYLTGFPVVEKHKYTARLKTNNKDQIINFDDSFELFKPQHDLEPVEHIQAGPEAALNTLHSFIMERLKFYGINSNDPSKNTTSNLSYWLHFGHVSAQRIALEIKSLESLFKDQVEKYLEELIVRKELADNYCYHNENYDNINGAAEWAIKTLKDHRKDKRTWMYTRDQLANAATHDEMWNAAQIQLRQEGKIHGYMRMYWCKKILEWTESPETAIEYSLWLNDTFALDGSDPNGYVGIMWSICCVHDQGWKERDIFGKIRYMVDYSLRRKFDMDAYCARYGLKLNKQIKKGTKRKASTKS